MLLVTSACGRIWFDPLATGGAGGDAGDAIDGSNADASLVTLSTTGQCPAVAYNDLTSTIGAVWRDGPFTGTTDVMFAAYSRNGSLVLGPITVGAALDNVDCPAITALDTFADFRIAISHGPINDHVIGFSTITGATATPVTDAATSLGDLLAPSLASSGDRVVLAMWDRQPSNDQVVMATYPVQGGGPAVQYLSGLVTTNGRPWVTATPANYVVTWAGGARPRIGVLDSTGLITSAEQVMADVEADIVVSTAFTGNGLVVAWPDGGSIMRTASLTAAFTLDLGPHNTTVEVVRDLAVAWSGVGAGGAVLYLERNGLVQTHVTAINATANVSTEVPVLGADPEARPSFVWADGVYVAASHDANGAQLKFLAPPP